VWRWGVFTLLWFAGCQTGAQHDLIVRELRKQEDQIYAMEDYLTQYQQLVCQYRAENAALRRQLAEMGVEAELPPPATPSSVPRDKRPSDIGPGAPRRATPPTNGTQPKPEIKLPDVPPLETSSQDNQPESGRGSRSTAELEDRVLPATVVELVEREPPKQVRLRGQVVENILRGHRIRAEVQALDATGSPLLFDGELSLMLLTTKGEGRQQQLARWDFPPEEVQAAVDAANGDYNMMFHLQLPSGVELPDSTELWARLLPTDGGKLLAHVELKFVHEPEQTKSEEAASPSLASVTEGDYRINEHQAMASSPLAYDLADAGWATARPDDVPGAQAKGAAGLSDWRPTSEPLPVAKSLPTSLRQVSRTSRATALSEKPRLPETLKRQSVAWSPHRSAEKSQQEPRTATAPSPPRWSPTR